VPDLFDTFSVGLMFAPVRRDAPDAIKFVSFADFLLMSTEPSITCWDQEVNTIAQVNFQATFSTPFRNWYVSGYVWTNQSCPNGASVQNNAEATDAFFFIEGDHWTYELNGFNRILYTVQPATLNYLGIYTQASVLYFPELCSAPPPPSGGVCLTSPTSFGNSNQESEKRKRRPQNRPVEPGDCGEWGWWDEATCQCMAGAPPSSPIVIDVSGNGYDLTNNSNGVHFDLNSDGIAEQLSWTSQDSDDGWLVLDRNNSGLIENGREMFGNFTSQPTPPPGRGKNGFLALATFDQVAIGGNNDGFISNEDSIFEYLRLWQDLNHNGFSDSNELLTLSQIGLIKISLDYKISKQTDANGNKFRFRSKVFDAQGSQFGRWAWDVFLIPESSN